MLDLGLVQIYKESLQFWHVYNNLSYTFIVKNVVVQLLCSKKIKLSYDTEHTSISTYIFENEVSARIQILQNIPR
jgi:hypothetical protein